MPLSDHEQRLLDQIERALYAEDPKFASTVRATDLRSHVRSRLWRAGALLIVGIVVLLVGVVSKQPVIGILGFLVMLTALFLALTSYKRVASAEAGKLRVVGSERRGKPTGGRSPRGSRPKTSFMERVNERWQRRWDERGRG